MEAKMEANQNKELRDTLKQKGVKGKILHTVKRVLWRSSFHYALMMVCPIEVTEPTSSTRASKRWLASPEITKLTSNKL